MKTYKVLKGYYKENVELSKYLTDLVKAKLKGADIEDEYLVDEETGEIISE